MPGRIFILISILGFCVSAHADELTYKDQLVGVLTRHVPELLEVYNPQNGQFGHGIWICTDQNRMYPLAVAYAYKHRDNPYYKDKTLLGVIIKAGDALIEDADENGQWVFRKKDGSTWGKIWMPWTYSRWIRSYDLIKDEQPQTIAIILVHLKTRVASDVISKLPDEIKTKVAIRVVNLDKVTSTIVDEVNEILKDILKTKKDSIANVSGGVDRLAEILNQTDEISSQLILNEMEESDMEMAAQIKQRMFVFEDIILVDDRGVQKLLRKVETMELAIALKAASEEAREKVFKNMSSRAGEMLKEEIEDMGPVRMKEVEDAQQNITNFIQEMETKGELIIAGRRGEEIIA